MTITGVPSLTLMPGSGLTQISAFSDVFCDSCEHAHAVLPDVIIPYSSFSLLFVLRLLGHYFANLGSIEQLCERFGVSQNLFYKWLKLWNSHKQRWLGVLADSETSSISFWKKLYEQERYSYRGLTPSQISPRRGC